MSVKNSRHKVYWALIGKGNKTMTKTPPQNKNTQKFCWLILSGFLQISTTQAVG